MTSYEALKDILRIEKEIGLYDYEIDGIKLWNLFRAPYRYKFVSKATGVPPITNVELKRGKVLKELLYCIYSFTRLFKLFTKNKQFDNVVFSFGRLQENQGVFFDKFTDPVIDASVLSNSYCIFQLPCPYPYKGHRRHEHKVIPLDFLYILSYCLLPFCFLMNIVTGVIIKIYKLYKTAKQVIPLSPKNFLYMWFMYMRVRTMASLYGLIFKRIRAKNVFGVGRRAFMDATYSAHRLHIPVYEFQHGVTHRETEYYSGPGCKAIDPDYFLAFGKLWNGDQFGIDPNKIINVGWAYKDECKVPDDEVISNSVLLISSPEITHSILKTAVELTVEHPNFNFYIRCHPYEKYSEEQKSIVDKTNNLFLDDNSVDSLIALGHYQYVIGGNSSVVYEALSLGKPVGRICYNGIESVRFSDSVNDGFFYLYNVSDFVKLLNAKSNSGENLAYSSFNPDLFINLPRV